MKQFYVNRETLHIINSAIIFLSLLFVQNYLLINKLILLIYIDWMEYEV